MAHGPTDDPAAVEVDDTGEVEANFPGAELGHVRRPHPVTARRIEPPVDQVRSRCGVEATPPPTLASVHADQAGIVHKPGDPLAGATLVEATQFGVDPGYAVSAP
jgi:hypothetical protein